MTTTFNRRKHLLNFQTASSFVRTPFAHTASWFEPCSQSQASVWRRAYLCVLAGTLSVSVLLTPPAFALEEQVRQHGQKATASTQVSTTIEGHIAFAGEASEPTVEIPPVAEDIDIQVHENASNGNASVLVNGKEVMKFRSSRQNLTPAIRAKKAAYTLYQYLQRGGKPTDIYPKVDDRQQVAIYAGEHVVAIIDSETAEQSKNKAPHLALVWSNLTRSALGVPKALQGVVVSTKNAVVDLSQVLGQLGNQAGKAIGGGMASWYGPGFHGRRCADGSRFNMNSLTAAHRTLPFGTLVRVTNKRNGKQCVVKITDRGPFSHGRVIDLSKGAASQIGMLGSGTASVQLEVLGKTNKPITVPATVDMATIALPQFTPIEIPPFELSVANQLFDTEPTTPLNVTQTTQPLTEALSVPLETLTQVDKSVESTPESFSWLDEPANASEINGPETKASQATPSTPEAPSVDSGLDEALNTQDPDAGPVSLKENDTESLLRLISHASTGNRGALASPVAENKGNSKNTNHKSGMQKSKPLPSSEVSDVEIPESITEDSLMDEIILAPALLEDIKDETPDLDFEQKIQPILNLNEEMPL